MKRMIILLAVIVVMTFILAACGVGNDKQEQKVAGQTVDFHEIQFQIPDYYVFDEAGSDDETVYYKSVNDDGITQKMVMIQYQDDMAVDYSDEEAIKGYEEGIIDGETFYESDGFKTVKIDDQLSAIETSCKYDGDNGTNDVEIMAFSDSDLHPYQIIIITDDGSSKKQMQDINDSFRYSFDAAKSKEPEEAEGQEEEPEYYFKDNIIKTKDRTIKITKWEVIKPGKNPYSSFWYQDEPAIAFWYEVTNDSEKNIPMASSWEWAVELLQDNSDDYENTLQNTMIIPDESLSDNYLKDIKPGGTLKCAAAYTLTDETTPVTLIAKNGLLGEELGRKDYKIK